MMSSDHHMTLSSIHPSTTSVLKAATLLPLTLARYNDKLQLFLNHFSLTLDSLPTLSRHRIDALFSVWLDHYHQHGGIYTYATWAFHGLLYHVPRLRNHLPDSHQRLDGWQRVANDASHSHAPLTWELTCVIAVTLARWGDIAAAVCVLLGFHCYMRISELVHLKYADVAQLSDDRLGEVHVNMAIRLAKAKTGDVADRPALPFRVVN
jgi:hypothetical protein